MYRITYTIKIFESLKCFAAFITKLTFTLYTFGTSKVKRARVIMITVESLFIYGENLVLQF